ncbi:NlpC/P60 family peptidoglycan endopeptidase RipA [Mycolicibacterium celeriflavum]|uniref:Peptidoglycan endopeptidase RipA n=1 Tax=Mycolicibacterium celeriflavum TaxID=1249101 RepID=A0A1X0BWY4_MYCCF|nr:NlpC/P60 family peptidoglycan endopeptidase RipA [Mycolicibacterium celeriflavum]MCV7236967.1 NlpC/P60 family peptidoglycan endopeptidase RipA [Mycolicibacterium celeriflavum]ORA48864.1 peptidase M23 [Mycolicibacterium celeriflavum]BBY42801.1 peptidoglycan endopeptidase RipA [Mycolicibacterium celeriflavum]
MRRTPGASATRPCERFCAALLAAVMLLATPGLSLAQPSSPESLAALVAEVAEADQKLQDLGAAIQQQQESVNKAIVDVQTARENADAAQREVEASRQRVQDANIAIEQAQKRFDSFAAATYVNGPSDSYLTASDPADIVKTAAVGQTLTLSSQKVIADLQRARTEQVNRDSAVRLAKQNADKAVAEAEASQRSAVSALTDAQETFRSQQAQLDKLTAERAAAQAKLEQARASSAPAASAPATPAGSAAPAQAAAPANQNWDRAPQGRDPGTGNWAGPWDPTLPAIPSAFVSGDPIAIINAVLGIAQSSAQVTQDLGRKFLQSVGLLPEAAPSPGFTNGAIPRVYGRQATEYVIKRAMSQLGVPYSWGGGNAAGPSRGIDSGAGTVGFDCSGLMLYAFAGVGIKLDHYSGSQYNAGRKVPSSQMRRGDMLFWGPNASQHVALYLGDGQMLEAPYTGSVVKVSPVRTSGMTPYATRLIEW